MSARAVALAVVAALLAAAPAQAAIKRKKDSRAGVTFRLDGRHLTMKLSEQANPRTARKLLGKRVTAACGTSTVVGRGRIVHVDFDWPADRASVAVDFARDISRNAAYCLVEDARTARDIAGVLFAG